MLSSSDARDQLRPAAAVQALWLQAWGWESQQVVQLELAMHVAGYAVWGTGTPHLESTMGTAADSKQQLDW